MRATRLAPLATTLLLVTLGVTACSDDTPAEPGTSEGSTPSADASTSDDSSPSTSESPSAEADRPTIEITFEGDTVTPNGERVSVPLGEEVDLVVTADRPGELHVHSTPEQELSYEAGTTTLPVTFDQPGVVEVESHDLGLTIVQLEVR